METATLVLSLGKSYQLSQTSPNAITFVSLRTASPFFILRIPWHAARKQLLIVQNAEKRYHLMTVSKTKQQKMN